MRPAQKFRVSETSDAPAGRAGIAAHYVEGAGANVSAGHANASVGTHEYLHSHSEWIVGRSRALMNNPG